MEPAAISSNGIPFGGNAVPLPSVVTAIIVWNLYYHDNNANQCQLTAMRHDNTASAYMEQFAKRVNVTLPEDLHTVMTWPGIDKRFRDIFPAANTLRSAADAATWLLAVTQHPDQHMLQIARESQRSFSLYAGWRDGADKCRVWSCNELVVGSAKNTTSMDSVQCKLVSRTLYEFMYSYGVAGINWYDRYEHAKRSGDITEMRRVLGL